MLRLWRTPDDLSREWRKVLRPLRTIRWWQWMLTLAALLGYVSEVGNNITVRGLFGNSVLILILLMFLEDTWKRRIHDDVDA